MKSILDLPLELLRSVAGGLDFADLCNFAISRRFLASQLLGSENFCKELAQRLIPYAKETSLADSRNTSYRKAIISTYQRRLAYARCEPLSVITVPAAASFLYNKGTLCYLIGSIITVDRSLDAKPPIVINLDLVFPDRPEDVSFRLVHYDSGVLTVRMRSSLAKKLKVFLIDNVVNQNCTPTLSINLPSKRLIVVRNNSDHVVVGVYKQDDLDNGVGLAWYFSIFSLKGNPQRRLVQIGNFRTTDIGGFIVVEVLDGHLWIISSQITKDNEGRDPISFYGGCYVSLRDPRLQPRTATSGKSSSSTAPAFITKEFDDPTFFRIWRRQHREGPIHDAWCTLSLTKSEAPAPALKDMNWSRLHNHPTDDVLSPSPTTSSHSPSPSPSPSSLDDTSDDETPPPAPPLPPSNTVYTLSEARAEWHHQSQPSPARSYYTTTFTPFNPQTHFTPEPTPSTKHLPPLARLARASHTIDTDEYVEEMLTRVRSQRVVEIAARREHHASPGARAYKTLSASAASAVFTPEPVPLSAIGYRTFDPSSCAALDIVRVDAMQPARLRVCTSATRRAGTFPKNDDPGGTEIGSGDGVDGGSKADLTLGRSLTAPPPGRPLLAFSDSSAVVFGTRPNRANDTTTICLLNFDPGATWGRDASQRVVPREAWGYSTPEEVPPTRNITENIRTEPIMERGRGREVPIRQPPSREEYSLSPMEDPSALGIDMLDDEFDAMEWDMEEREREREGEKKSSRGEVRIELGPEGVYGRVDKGRGFEGGFEDEQEVEQDLEQEVEQEQVNEEKEELEQDKEEYEENQGLETEQGRQSRRKGKMAEGAGNGSEDELAPEDLFYGFEAQV